MQMPKAEQPRQPTVPGLPDWFSWGLSLATAAAMAIAALLSAYAAGGGLNVPLPNAWNLYFDDHSSAGLGALVAGMAIVGLVQFKLRLRRAPESARTLSRELIAYLASMMAAAVAIVTIWPRDIVVATLHNSDPELHSLDYQFWVRGMKTRIGSGSREFDPRPWLLVLSKNQQQKMATQEDIATCNTEAGGDLGPFNWRRYVKPLPNGFATSINDTNDFREYCKAGIQLDSIRASDNAKALLKTQMAPKMDFSDDEVLAAEGNVGTVDRLSPRGRYLLYNASPAAAVEVPILRSAGNVSASMSSGWTGGYQAVDHRVALFECNQRYADFLIAKGIRPSRSEVLMLVGVMLGQPLPAADANPNEPEEASLARLRRPDLTYAGSDEGVLLRSRDTTKCVGILNSWLRATSLLPASDETSREPTSEQREPDAPMALARIGGNHIDKPMLRALEDIVHAFVWRYRDPLRREVFMALMRHSGSIDIFMTLSQAIRNDDALAEWAMNVDPADVSRKIPQSALERLRQCDLYTDCLFTKHDAGLLFGHFVTAKEGLKADRDQK